VVSHDEERGLALLRERDEAIRRVSFLDHDFGVRRHRDLEGASRFLFVAVAVQHMCVDQRHVVPMRELPSYFNGAGSDA
jgi:hypothetical protein